MDRNIDVAILKIYNKLFENGFVEKKSLICSTFINMKRN